MPRLSCVPKLSPLESAHQLTSEADCVGEAKGAWNQTKDQAKGAYYDAKGEARNAAN